MSEAQVTVAIPTYNRSQLLKLSLESVLAQDYSDLRIVVLDNASVDDTEAVVRSFADRDQRVTYVRNDTNIGVLNNWNRAIALNSSPYLTILSDGDVMLTGFIRESVLALDKHPRAAFSFALARFIDFNSALLDLQKAEYVPDGVISGLDFLDLRLSYRGITIYNSTVLMRTAALAVVGSFDSPHTNHTFDLTMYLRMAAHFDLVFLRQELVHVRQSPGQRSENHWRSDSSRSIGEMAELLDAIAYLLQSDRATDASYRQWLTERLLAMNAYKSECMRLLAPSKHHELTERRQQALQEIVQSIPLGKTFILVDEAQWGIDGVADRHAIPFLERNGQYWGPPPDDATALSELERLRCSGASFIVFGWPAFWWLDYYSELHRQLCSQCRCVLKNSRLIIFDLQLVCQELGNRERGTLNSALSQC